MKKILLTPEQFEQKASVLANVLNDISIVTDLINFLPHIKDPRVQANPLLYYSLVKGSMSNVFAKLQDIEQEIDDVAFILFNTTDKKELEAMGVEVVD